MAALRYTLHRRANTPPPFRPPNGRRLIYDLLRQRGDRHGVAGRRVVPHDSPEITTHGQKRGPVLPICQV